MISLDIKQLIELFYLHYLSQMI